MTDKFPFELSWFVRKNRPSCVTEHLVKMIQPGSYHIDGQRAIEKGSDAVDSVAYSTIFDVDNHLVQRSD
jgi:hypothetical protein